MGSLKAVGLDDYQAIFYKKTWSVTRPALISIMLGVLRGEEVPLEAVEAALVLIPKEEKPYNNPKL